MRTHQTQARLEQFHACGANLWVQRDAKSDAVRIVGNCCHDRFCTPCATVRATRIRENLRQHLQHNSARFLTLTLRHSNTPLADQLDRLHRSFTELRRREFWKSNVTGGVAFLEVKVSERDHMWHVHMHVLIEGQFIDQRQLSQEWHAVTGDSSIVDVRRVTSSEAAASYITKYVTKPADASVFAAADKLDEFILAMKGRRVFNPFGTLRKLHLDHASDAEGEWQNVTSLANLLEQCERGEVGSIVLMARLEERYPKLRTWWHVERPPPPTATPC